MFRLDRLIAAASLVAAAWLIAAPATAATRIEIDARVNGALEQLYQRSPAARDLSGRAVGILVFPRVLKGGFGIGGEYGEGSLLVGGAPVQYYRLASASVGFQFGGQARSQVLMFLTEDALRTFRAGDGWQVGIDGSVALAEFGAGEALGTYTINEPIIAFVFGNQGLMYNLSLEGSRYWPIEK
jgi:lipid-binding SYLF domain-containing protein